MISAHIFNPEHDFALAAGPAGYTPPASVVALRDQLAWIPILWRSAGDLLIIESTSPRRYDSIPGVFRLGESAPSLLHSVERILPWGWDEPLCRRLLAAGFPARLLPSADSLRRLRQLSHRRTALLLARHLDGEVDGLFAGKRFEATDVGTVMQHLAHNPALFLKAPWSSSGRGVLRTCTASPRQVEQWVRGIVRRQGSVIVEPELPRVLDCATLWTMQGGKARFRGVSVFETSPRGKYICNLYASQKTLLQEINARTPDLTPDLISRISGALEETAGDYEGPLGIDMIVDSAGRLHPCVEINFRMTMGHVALNLYLQNEQH